MKKIKTCLVLVLALVMLVMCTACGSTKTEEKTTLRFGTSADYPPFEFIILDEKGNQQYVGIDVAVAQAIADDMGLQLEVVNMDFDNLMASVQKGDVDIVIAAIEDTPEREEAADFSDPYYTDYPPMILVKKDNADKFSSVEDFNGLSVGAQTGTTKADIVNDDMTGANLVALTSVLDLVNQLTYDKVDAIVLDGAVAMQYAEANEDLVVADVDLGEAYPYCVAVQKGDPSGLLKSINETIAKLVANGDIAKFSDEANAISDQAI